MHKIENKMEKMDGEVDSGSAILSSSSLVLQPFITKLGHNVEEIRVRALKNILLKLEHKLICVSDLVQERELLIRLLEWFNYTSAPMKKEVLGLLEKLSKHVTAAQVLLSVGAVEFLSQLRQDEDPELFQDIDNVTHLLLSIPQTAGDTHDDWCLYRPRDDEEHSNIPVSVHCGSHLKVVSSYTPSLPNTTQPRPPIPTRTSAPLLGTPKGYFKEEKESFPSSHDNTSHAQSSISTTRSQDSVLHSSGSLSFFKWLPLSSSDRHILAVTDSRLQNNSPTLVSKSCEFLADVLFKDFPAEIFLQRPSVFKSLIGLLEFQGSDNGPCVPQCAIHCLKELCCHVHARLMATADPALFCPDQECWKSRQNMFLSNEVKNAAGQQGEEYIQERGSGDGGLGSDAPSSSSSSTEHHPTSSTEGDDEEDELVMEALQYNQLAVEEMCVMLLPQALQVMNGHLSSHQQVLTSTVELLFHVGELIKTVAPDDVWQEGSQSNIVMASNVVSSLKLLGEVLVHHIQESGYQGHGVREEHSLSTHRITVVNLTMFLVHLLQTLVPLDIASRVVPSDTVTVIWLLSMDGILSTTHPPLHDCLLEYLSVLDSSSYQTYQHAKNMCQSFQSTCELLKASKSKTSSIPVSKQLSLAEDSLLSIAYHRHMGLIKESIQLSRTTCSPETSPSIVQACHSTVLRILSHYDRTIRVEGYKECLGVVKESLRISHVTHPLSTVCQGILFLLDTRVMYQICCFGLYDEDQEVQSIAVDLLETLLLGRLSMSSQLWKRLLDVITPTLPFLEGFIGTHPTLDQSILELVLSSPATSGQITSDGQVMTLKARDQLKGALMLMFLQNPSIRTQGLAAVVGHLTADKTSSWGQRLFRSRQTENLRDLFIVDQLTSTMNSHTPMSHPSVEKAEIVKLWSIYSSKSMDWNIRKSAAEQLAIILQDPEWHSELLDLKAEETTLEILREILQKDADTHTPTTPSSSMEIVPPCLKILRLLTEYSWSCRRRLVNKMSVYTIIVMCSVVCRPSVQASYEAACLLALLLFDEVAQYSVEKSQRRVFSLPSCLVKRYQLPFNPAVHKSTSEHQLPPPQNPDPLKTDPALSMLRFHWNLSWHESLEKLCAVQGDDGRASPSKQHKFWESLRWTAVDCQVLRCSHVPVCLGDDLQVMSTAVSHFPAKVALMRIRASLMGDLGVAHRGDKMAIEKLYAMNWQEALERYLLVLPNSVDDDELLIEVLRLLSSMLTSPSRPPEPVVAWMARNTIKSDGPLLSLLRTPAGDSGNVTSQAGTESRRNLRKTILLFFSNLVRCLLQCSSQWRFDGERVLIGELAYAVTLNLDLADNPSYYDLPVLESALECLGHVSACSQWSAHSRSQDALGLCTSLLQSLVQVVSAFHAGRLGSSTSFMGKGVTFHASLCLVHLVKELDTKDPNKSWISNWIQDDGDGQALAWLVTLWSDRSPEVRWMGLSIATSLASTVEGYEALFQALQGVAGGVIGISMPLILDDGECGMVRQQATLLLCSIISNLSTGASLVSGTSQDPGNQESLSIITTLRALMDHYRFYFRLNTILTNFSTNALSQKATSSRACQSTASVSVSTTSSNIPYRHLQSSSQSVSVTSEAVLNASHSSSPVPNRTRSPGDQGTVPLSNGSLLSSNASGQTQESQSPISSLVPLLNERGLPSGMSTSSGTTNTYVPSEAGSLTSRSSPVTSSHTPAFVGALAQLMQALVTADSAHTITALKRSNMLSVFWSHLDSSELQSFLQVQDSSPSLSCAAVVVVREVLHMYSCLVQMTHALARVDHTLLFDLQQDAVTMHRIVGLLAVVVSDLDDKLLVHCQVLWLSVSSLLVTLLQSQGPVSVPSVTEQTVYKHWTYFTALFKMVMSRPNQATSLKSVLLKLLCLLLSCEGKRQKQKKKNDSSNASLGWNKKSQLVEILDDGTPRSSLWNVADGTDTIRDTQELPNQVPPSKTPCVITEGTGGTFVDGTNITRVSHEVTNKGPIGRAPTGQEKTIAEHESVMRKNERNSRTKSCKDDITSGEQLCSSLLSVFDGMGWKVTDEDKKDKNYIKIAITALLALSQTAKVYAIQEGLVETTLEHIKHLHVQLNMDSLQLGKGPSWRKKENPLIDEIISDLDLLGNFIYRNADVKVTCLECGLIDVLHKLWSWCTVEVTLRSAVLSLLCTLTARCPKASIYIGGGSSTSRASQSGSTFLNSLLKTAVSTNGRVLGDQACHDLDVQLATLKTLLSLFSNLLLTAECRGIIWKSNFLHQFSKLKPLKTPQGRPKHVHRAVGVSWLSILVNLTFFTDGQQMVMKIPSCVSILLEFCRVTQGKYVTSDMSLLVVRNLCFHSNSKSVLLSNEALLLHLISNVDHMSSYTRALAVSALWSLVHNNQKAKVTLKNSGLQKKLEELRLKSDKEPTQSDDKYQKIYTQALDVLNVQMTS